MQMERAEQPTFLSWLRKNMIVSVISVLLAMTGFVFGIVYKQVSENEATLKNHEYRLTVVETTVNIQLKNLDDGQKEILDELKKLRDK